MKEIYTFVMDRGVLSEKHKADLITGRGFPEKAIQEQRFFSGGPYLAPLEEEMMALFDHQALVSSGIFMYDGGKIRMTPILLREENVVDSKAVPNIVIPYLSADGSAYCLRPHKLGFRGVQVEIFQQKALASQPTEIILTEGEFKAFAASQVMGIPAIGIPGISSFSEQHFQRLVDFMKPCVKKVVVIFDNEVKDDPTNAKRYKENPQDRYDTDFYAYWMATRLEEAGFETRVGVLPDAWREDGKIDIDGALKAGRGRGDILRVMYEALPRNEYLRELPTEAKEVVLRKRAQRKAKGHIKKEFNRYVATRQRGRSVWQEAISNFVMRIVATHDTSDGIRRVVEFQNEFGRRSSAFAMPPECMSTPDKFRTFCLNKGDFVWKGSIDDLMTIWESEFLMMDEGRYILEADQIGWVESEKCWVFGNVAISKEGNIARPDSSGVFWFEKRGVKPSPLLISSGKNAMAGGIPNLYLGDKAPSDGEILQRLSEAVGPEEARVMIGWAVSVAFMEDVFATYGCFPFLFVSGRWQSGKSTVAGWLTRLFGIEQEGLSISQTTPVAIQRSLGYYSSLPVYLDEFRNTKDVTSKNGFLRNAYNRQSAGKGVKDAFGLREAKIRGTLIIAGEETPKDGALLSRAVHIFVSRAKRTKDNYAWFTAEKARLSGFFYRILKDREAVGRRFVAHFQEWKEAFSKDGKDDRVAINYAAVVAGYAAVYGTEDLGFADWLMKETTAQQAEFREEQAISMFLDDLMALKTRKLVDDQYWSVEGDKIYIYFHGLHGIWAENFRKVRGEEAFKEGSIRAYLKEESGFIEANALKWIKGQNKKCVVFDARLASSDLRNLVGWDVEPPHRVAGRGGDE